MTVVDIIAIIISVISVILGLITGILSWRSSVEREKQKLYHDFIDYAAILKAVEPEMKETLKSNERELISRIVWRWSSIPLASVLDKPEERSLLFRVLANPDQSPWKDEDS